MHNLIQVPIRFLGPHDSEYEFVALVDTGASGTFYNGKTVQCLNFTPQGSCVLVKNGDGSSQYSLGSIHIASYCYWVALQRKNVGSGDST